MEKKLAYRLQEAIKSWTRLLKGQKDDDDLDSVDDGAHKIGGEPQIQSKIYEIRLTQQVMYLSPSVEEARQNLLEQLFAWQAIITSQPRITSTRYQVGLDRSAGDTTYRNLLAKLPGGIGVLEAAYDAVEQLINKVRGFVQVSRPKVHTYMPVIGGWKRFYRFCYYFKCFLQEWLRYQALWDLQPDQLYERLGTDLGKWMKTLVEIK